MKIVWTSKALSGLVRVHEFLARVNKPSAARRVLAFTKAPEVLLSNPQLGERLEEFAPREVRRVLVVEYELRYELQETTIFISRIWHTKENR
ncbi:MAG: type II toxin-antitoxin system RelE/ParE family toxin [Spirochaetales bacterium]